MVLRWLEREEAEEQEVPLWVRNVKGDRRMTHQQTGRFRRQMPVDGLMRQAKLVVYHMIWVSGLRA